MSANDPTTKAFYILATRYLGGEASSTEREQLVGQLTDPVWQAQFQQIRQAWEQAGDATAAPSFDVDQAAGRLQARLAAEKTSAGRAPATRRRHSFDWRLAMLAASLVIGIAALGVKYLSNSPEEYAQPHRHLVQLKNAVGERSVVTLPDGTKVTLNAMSTLVYPEIFGADARTVRLKGEAFFEVIHDAKHPFIVLTPNLQIRVLGTKFSVNSFDDNTAASVDLIEGQVRVVAHGPQGTAEPQLLAPGHRFTYAPATGLAQVRSIAPEAVLGWMEDRLILDSEPLSSVMRRLERRFGVPIELHDAALAEQTLTGRFDGESLERIFELLRLAGMLDYELVRANGKIDRVIVSPSRLAGKAPARN